MLVQGRAARGARSRWARSPATARSGSRAGCPRTARCCACELDEKWAATAQANIERPGSRTGWRSGSGRRSTRCGPCPREPTFDFAYLDADKAELPRLLRGARAAARARRPAGHRQRADERPGDRARRRRRRPHAMARLNDRVADDERVESVLLAHGRRPDAGPQAVSAWQRQPADRPAARRVRILAAGGTIAMTGTGNGPGSRAPRPTLDGDALIAAVPGLCRARRPRRRETVVNVPSAHLTLERPAAHLPRGARRRAPRASAWWSPTAPTRWRRRRCSCDVLHDAEAPIVFTGAIRPASAPGRRRARQPRRRRERGRQRGRHRHSACSCASAARSTTPAACARPTPPRWWPSPHPRPGRSAA